MHYCRQSPRLLLLLLWFVAMGCQADSADVLPAGVFNVDANLYIYRDIDSRYNENGDVEDFAVDYNGTLDSAVFPDLAGFDPFFDPDKANIGDSVVSFKLVYRWSEFALRYGVTDKLSVGILMPYNYSRNEVKAELDSTNANVGKNPAYDPLTFDAGDPSTYPLVPIGLGGVPMTTEDAQQLLGAGLDVNDDGTPDVPGFGYERFGSWSGSGIGDIEVGAKYQFYNTKPWRTAVSGGLRLPTGEVDSPDHLADLGFGDGQTDVLLRLHGDYLGIENLLLNATFRYDVQLSDKQEKRVAAAVDAPLTDRKERVKRDLGDIAELELSGTYSFTPEWSAGIRYRYTQAQSDEVSGTPGLSYSSLEDETAFRSQMYFIDIGYSTLEKFQNKQFAIPMYVGFTYRNRFDGKNNVTKSEFFGFNVGVYF